MIEFIIPQPGRKCNPGRNSSALGTAALSAREPGMGAREPALSAREPGMGAREPGMGARKPALSAREPGMGAEKPKSGHCAYKSGALF